MISYLCSNIQFYPVSNNVPFIRISVVLLPFFFESFNLIFFLRKLCHFMYAPHFLLQLLIESSKARSTVDLDLNEIEMSFCTLTGKEKYKDHFEAGRDPQSYHSKSDLWHKYLEIFGQCRIRKTGQKNLWHCDCQSLNEY